MFGAHFSIGKGLGILVHSYDKGVSGTINNSAFDFRH